MIGIRVRHIVDGDGLKLGNFEASEVNEVVSLVRAYGVYLPDKEDLPTCKYVQSQFVVSETERFFEIIVE